MFSNGCVSLYHYNEKNEEWVRSFFPCAGIYRKFGSESSKCSFASDNYCVIRIPYYADSDIAIGDYICLENSRAAVPDKTLCLKVTAFCRNKFGSSPHLKIICA